MADFITILGPTASGKTKLAVNVASKINGAIISADSRQTYRGLDIGSGKDLDEYQANGRPVEYRLIDICEIDHEYNLFEFQTDFLQALKEIKSSDKTPILCGGTGLYLDAVLKGYNLQKAPENKPLRAKLASEPDESLIEMLRALKSLHNKTDIEERERLVRAIEIAVFERENPQALFPKMTSIIFGIRLERKEVKERITRRLRARLQGGMIEEVEGLLKRTSPARLRQLGLEYRYVAEYLRGHLNYNDMFQSLNSAIHAFAKRQMTWFRKMEREGAAIHWIDGRLSLEEQTETVIQNI